MELSHHFIIIIISSTQAFPVIGSYNIHYDKGRLYQTCEEYSVFSLMSLIQLSTGIFCLGAVVKIQ